MPFSFSGVKVLSRSVATWFGMDRQTQKDDGNYL
jgi:hypothetical protein